MSSIIERLNEKLRNRNDFEVTHDRLLRFLEKKEIDSPVFLVKVTLSSPSFEFIYSESSSDCSSEEDSRFTNEECSFTFGFFATSKDMIGEGWAWEGLKWIRYDAIFPEKDKVEILYGLSEDHLSGDLYDPKTDMYDCVKALALYIGRNLDTNKYAYDGSAISEYNTYIFPGTMCGIVMYGNWETEISRTSLEECKVDSPSFPVLGSLQDLFTILHSIGGLYEEGAKHYSSQFGW